MYIHRIRGDGNCALRATKQGENVNKHGTLLTAALKDQAQVTLRRHLVTQMQQLRDVPVPGGSGLTVEEVCLVSSPSSSWLAYVTALAGLCPALLSLHIDRIPCVCV